MFDIWRKIEEKGAVAVPIKPDALMPLIWVEIGEKWPELVPEKYRHWDIYSDPQLILGSPFVEVEGKHGHSFRFQATDLMTGENLDVAFDVDVLINVFNRSDFRYSEEDDEFGGFLTCLCGCVGCDGLWQQAFHVSDKMVHWSVIRYDEKFELFYEREAYEVGAFRMLKTLVENPGVFRMTNGNSYEECHHMFVAAVDNLLSRKSYYHEIWDELNQN